MVHSNKIRVLVVDDSALMRKLITGILSQSPDIEVVATAVDGITAIKKAGELKPDVITLDIDMPQMDGLTALRHIIDEFMIPVIIVSSHTEAGAEITLRALDIGAMDFITKPQDSRQMTLSKVADELVKKVRMLACISPASLHRAPAEPAAAQELKPVVGNITGRTAARVIAIGISTGGPNALSYMLPKIPADITAGIMIVQHMPAGFTGVFASRLNKLCSIEVKEGEDGDMVIPGRAIVAPGGKHLKVKMTRLGAVAVISDSPPVNGHKPSADVLFNSVAAEYGSEAVGVIMTGMGNDGADGLGRIKAAGGVTVAQDEKSCVVYGMPKVAFERGHADRVVPLENMADAITEIISKKGGEEVYAAGSEN